MCSSLRAAALLILLLVSFRGAGMAQATADQALRRMAAELLPRVETLSGLEAVRPLNVASRTRADFNTFLTERLREPETALAMRNATLAYRLLGLIPSDLDLADVSVELTTEEIGGYYDPRADTLYVLADLPSHRLRAVLVHEMVHALQAQHAPLDSLLSPALGGDRGSAARAAIEGHATVVEALFTMEELASQPVSLALLPDLTQVPLEFFFGDAPRPALLAAPAILRETMVFPYIRGAGFVQSLWRRDPGRAPFAEWLPTSTEQVMDPERRFFDARDAPADLVLESGAASPWEVVAENTLGQYELSILLRDRHYLHGSERWALGWAGDRYQVLTDGTDHVLLWYLAWDDGRSAFDFATGYRQILNQRLNRTGWVEELTVEGRHLVRVVEAFEEIEYASLPRPQIRLVVAPPR